MDRGLSAVAGIEHISTKNTALASSELKAMFMAWTATSACHLTCAELNRYSSILDVKTNDCE